MRIREIKDKLELRSIMEIKTVDNLMYVLWPKLLIPIIDDKEIILFKQNRLMLTANHEKAPDYDIYKDLYDQLPAGIQGLLHNGIFYVYDLVCLETYGKSYIERYKYIENLLKVKYNKEYIKLIPNFLIEDEEDMYTYIDSCKEKPNGVYLREVRGLYYQGKTGKNNQGWLRYYIPYQIEGVFKEHLPDKRIIFTLEDGNDAIAKHYLLDKISTVKEGDKITLIKRNKQYYFYEY